MKSGTKAHKRRKFRREVLTELAWAAPTLIGLCLFSILFYAQLTGWH